MANETKAAVDEELRAAGIDKIAYSRKHFCARNGISTQHLAKLKRLGLGPHETDLHGVIVIYAEDEAAWRAAIRAKSAA